MSSPAIRAATPGSPELSRLMVTDRTWSNRAEALPAQLGAQMWCPQALVANLLLEWVDNAASLVGKREKFAAREEHFERFHLVADKLANPDQLLLELGFG